MRHWLLLTVTLAFSGCAEHTPPSETIDLQGRWLMEENGEVMLNPQTSGLKSWRGKLLSVSDASADSSQLLQLHIIDPNSATVAQRSLPIRMSEAVKQGCFGPYLGTAPDLEALAIDPEDDNVMVLVTEDATRTGGLTEQCASQYAQTGSTDYPTLLLRVTLQQDQSLLLDAVRPLQFSSSFEVGNSPNDGIEGLAFAHDRTLYLGLEKDAKTQARIFSVTIDSQFWQQDTFAKVQDPQLLLPRFTSGNHPINGMDYYPHGGGKGYIIAAARNDNDLWIIDLAKKKPTKVIPVQFFAPTSPECGEWELMDNASLEGVAVTSQQLFVINDPWKRHYTDNIRCEVNRVKYEKMAPLLFSMPIEPQWFN